MALPTRFELAAGKLAAQLQILRVVADEMRPRGFAALRRTSSSIPARVTAAEGKDLSPLYTLETGNAIRHGQRRPFRPHAMTDQEVEQSELIGARIPAHTEGPDA
jgi:hypothetical protein